MNKNKFHILVVDDDDRIRELVKEYLAENNFIVTTAKDAMDKGYLNQGIGKYIREKEEELFISS